MDLLVGLSILNVEHEVKGQVVKSPWLEDRKPVNKSCTCVAYAILKIC